MRKERVNRGAALITALIIVTMLTLLVGGALTYALTGYELTWAEARSESALHMAEGGINDELTYIAANVGAVDANGNPDPSRMSSQPTVQNGETMVSPFTGSVVLGRRGTVTGDPNGNFWVYTTVTDPTTNNTPVAWNGTPADTWIVSTAYVNGSWRRAWAKRPAGNLVSLFNLYAIFALAAYPDNSPAIQMSAATVTISGIAGTNGKVINNNSTLGATNCLNCNTASVSSSLEYLSGTPPTGNVLSGGKLYSQSAPKIFPTVTAVLSTTTGKTWTQLSTANMNDNGIYTFKPNVDPTTAAVNSSNCQKINNPGLNNMLTNQSGGGYTNAWSQIASVTFFISSATNTNPILVTTSSKHHLSDGDQVTIQGVVGNTAANGTFYVKTPNGQGFSPTTQFYLYSNAQLNQGVPGNGAYVSGGTGQKALAISGASNASPIEITTPTNHGFSTGDSVTIQGVVGNTAANGSWLITKTGNKTFTLNNSTGNGAYTSGGTITENGVRVLIMEPGDYYFNRIRVLGDPTTVLVMDPMAFASGGTPGQIRIWVNNPNTNSVQTDEIDIPITATRIIGASNADPQYFRLYYGQDKGVFSFGRPSGYTNWDGSDPGTFNVYGAVYAVTKQPGDTSSLSGTTIDFTGATSAGSITLNGALIADKVTFHGYCNVNFLAASNPGDPGVITIGGALGGYSDGG